MRYGREMLDLGISLSQDDKFVPHCKICAIRTRLEGASASAASSRLRIDFATWEARAVYSP
jgi:hypothetical protein